MKNAAKYLVYPILLVGCISLIALTFYYHWHLTTALFIGGGLALIYLSLLERYMPQYIDWKQAKTDWKFDIPFFISGNVMGPLAQFCAIGVAIQIDTHFRLTSTLADLPLLAAIPLALLLGDFFAYLLHRHSHGFRSETLLHTFLWKVHSIHHLPNKLYTLNNARSHPLNVFLAVFFRLTPILLLGGNAEIIFAVGVFEVVINYAAHANIAVKTGWLNYIFITPDLHRYHHSNQRKPCNFGNVVVFWDFVFGSLYIPGKKVIPAQEIGVFEEANYPKKFFKQLLFPFSKTKRTTNQG